MVSVEHSPAAHVWFSLARLGVATPSATPANLPAVPDAVLAGYGPLPDPNYRSDGLAAHRMASFVKKALLTAPSNGAAA